MQISKKLVTQQALLAHAISPIETWPFLNSLAIFGSNNGQVKCYVLVIIIVADEF